MKHLKTLSALALAIVLLVFLNASATAQDALSLTVRVTNDRGEALPGQTISLGVPAIPWATTDADGRYTFPVWPGTYSLWIDSGSYNSGVHAPMGYSLYTSSFDVNDNATLDLQLPFKKLTVHVQDSQGTAIPNVGIETGGPWISNLAIGSLPSGTLFASGYSGYSYNPPSGIFTNANGDVDLWLLPTPSDPMSCSMPPCTYSFVAHPPSDSQFPVTSLSDVTLAQDGSITITLNPAVTLTGQVTNDRGEALPGQSLYLSGPAGGQSTTDANGRYAFSVSAGTYSLSISSNPDSALHSPMIYNLNSSSFAVSQNTTLDLSLPFKDVSVHVVDTNGQPVAGTGLSTNMPWISGLTLGGLSFSGSSYYWYDPYINPNSVVTGADGNATLWLLPTDGGMMGEGYTFTAYPPAGSGLLTAILSSVAVTGDTSVTIRFTPPVTLSGRITDAAGNGLASQVISLSGPFSFSGLTDSDGHYAISASPGNYSLQISGNAPTGSTPHIAQNYSLNSNGSISLTQDSTLDLSLPFQRVNVHVLDASDQPVAGAGLNTDAPWVSGLTLGALSFSGSSSYWYAPDMGGGVTTDATGNATLWLLPTTGSMGGQGYAFTAYAPSETGLPPAYFPYVFVTGETDLTMRFAGAPLPPPVITSVSPDSVIADGPGFTLTVNGTGFVNGSTVNWNGWPRATTFVSSTLLTAAIPAPDLMMPAAGTAAITVVNPNWGGVSNSVTVRIVVPPVISNTSPTFLLANGFDQTLNVNGSWFVDGSIVQWNGSPRETTFVNPWALQARILGSDLAPTAGVTTATVTVVNPNGGGTSNSVSVTIVPFTGVTLSGRITDAAGNGLPNQGVTLTGPTWLSGSTDNTGHYAISASPGMYGLSLSGGVPISSTLHAPQGYSLYSNGAITLTQNTTLDLALPFQRINVHVVDMSDQPVAGAGLSAGGPGGSNFTVGSLSFWGYNSYSYESFPGMPGGVTTDASGNATLWLLPTGDLTFGAYTFTAYPPAETGLPPATLSGVFVTGETNVTIRFSPPVTLSGRITDAAGNGLPNQGVTLSGPVWFSGSTDNSGYYAVSASPGAYGLQLSGGVAISSTLHAPQFYSLWTYNPITLTQNTTLDLSLPFQRVNVHVVDTNEQPVSGAGLRTSSPSVYGLMLGGLSFSGSSSYGCEPCMGGSLTTDASGNATLWLLPVSDPTMGGYTFAVYAPAEMDLPPASLSNVLVTGETNVTVRFSPPVTLSGRITDAAGNGLANQGITLSGPIWLSGSTDNTGHYAISASPGTYGLSVSGGVPVTSTLHAPQSYSLWTYNSLALAQNTTLDLTLPFQHVNVHVVDANDQPVAGAGLGANMPWDVGLTLSDLYFSGSSSYSYDPYMGISGVTTDASGNATLWLLTTGDATAPGYTITAYPPAETGLTPMSLSSVLVTGETNVNIRLGGSLPRNAPVISSISPTSVAATSPSFTLVVTGTNFVNSSIVQWNGSELTTTFVSGTLLTAAVPTTLTVSAGTATITVFTPPPGGGTSNSVTLTIEQVVTVSTVASSASTSVYGQSITFTATVTSTIGAPSGTVSFKEGSTTLASGALTGGVATFVTSTLAVGTHAITVEYSGDDTFSPSISQAINQTVDKASTTLTLTGSSPSPAVVGQPVTVTFAIAVTAPGAASPTGTVAISDGSVSCTATLPSSNCPIVFSSSGSKSLVATYAGDANLKASTSPSMTLTLNNPVPILTSLSPNSAKAGDAGFVLTITGSDFVNESVVRWNGLPLATAFVNPTSLKVTVPASSIATPGAGYVTILNPTPGGGESNAQVLLTTDTGAFVTASSVGKSTTAAGTATATITGAGGQPILTATASGRGMISVAQYAANPGGAPSFNSAGAFVDVHVASGSAFTSVTIVDCYLNGGNVVYWWNGATWMLASDQAYNAATGCVTVTVNDTARPNLHDLAGTYLASSTDRTAPTVSAKGTTPAGNYTFGTWVTQTVQITLTAQDNDGGTGVKKITYAASGAQSIPPTDVVSSTATVSLTVEGETQVTYSAVDNAGNRSADQNVLVKIDQTVPVLGTCPVAGPFLLNSGLQPVGPMVASDVPAGLDASSSQLSGSVDTSSLGVKTVTFMAKDLAGNSKSVTCPYTVIPSATLNVYSALHTVGPGTTPGVQKAPLAMSVKIFDLATVPSADGTNYATVWNSGPALVSPLTLVTGPSVTTFGGGQANLYTMQVPAADSANKVTSGKYLVIGKVDGAETYVGAATDPLAPDSVTQEYLQVIRKSDGENVPAVTTSVPGSLLLIAEPSYLEFTSGTELLPIIYDSVDGTWSAVVQADPPQGFVSTPGALSVDVSTGQLEAVQFTIQDVGSQWTTTKVTNHIKHNGVDRTVISNVAMINRQLPTTRTPTPTASATPALTPTATLTATRTLTPTQTLTPIPTATITATATQTPTPKPTGTATATQTRKPGPKPTPTAVSASPTPKPTATPKKAPPATTTAAPTKTSPAKPKGPPTQTPLLPATSTPKKAPTETPMATATLPPTKTPHLTPTPKRTPPNR